MQNQNLKRTNSSCCMYQQCTLRKINLEKKITFEITCPNQVFINICHQRRERALQQNIQDTEKEIIKDTRQWKDFAHYWIGKIIIVIMTILLKLIYRFNKMPFKLSIYFTGLEIKQPWNLHRATNNYQEPR